MSDAPKVRMDRSRDFASVHGERAPGDPHANVHFYQDGLPFDAHGFMLPDLVDQANKKLVQLAESKLKKAAKAKGPKVASATPAGADDAGGDAETGGSDGDGDDEEGDDTPVEINLDAWLRGEQRVKWQEVTQEIARRYKKRVSNLGDAVVFLVQEKVVPADEVGAEFKKFLA